MLRIKTLVSRWILAISVVAVLGGLVSTITLTPSDVGAKTITKASDCSANLLTFPTWYRGLIKFDPAISGSECVIISPGQTPDGDTQPLELQGYIWRIALNVIEIGLQLVAYIAFGFILFGGFQYLTGGSEAAMIEKARKTLLNAVIGLAISMASIAVVNLVFTLLG
ncbi:MAG: hypothetical protein WAO28_02880 [Candidatus Microsaccharimonas sp.]